MKVRIARNRYLDNSISEIIYLYLKKLTSMAADNNQFKEQELVKLANDIRDKYLNKYKNLVHQDNIRFQEKKVKSRKDMISDAKVCTKMRDMTIRLLKAVQKKESKSDKKKKKATEISVVLVDEKLAEFLRLQKRGFKPVVNEKGEKVWCYAAKLVLSYFTNWVTATDRQDGKNVKISEKDDSFVTLFAETMKKPDTAGKKDSGESILSADGKIISVFASNKHMSIFRHHYPKQRKLKGKTYELSQVTVSKEQYPEIYARMEEERELLTVKMGDARNAYKAARKTYEAALLKKEKAQKEGDRTFLRKLDELYDDYVDARKTFVRLLNDNDFEHKLPNPTK
jgi:thymidine kinase